MKKYAIRADITWIVEVPDDYDLELALNHAINNLPVNTVILDIRGWPAYPGSNAADLDALGREVKQLGKNISAGTLEQ